MNDFDILIDRRNKFSAKWDEATMKYGDDIIPLSVADMDIPTSEKIVSELSNFNNGIYGYSICGNDYYKIVSDWFYRRYRAIIDPEYIVYCPRVIQAISIFIRKFTELGDYIGSFIPSYNPVIQCITANNRCFLPCKMEYINNEYHINLMDLESCFKKIKVFILISPHNPTGVVWSDVQLKLICDLAEKYKVFIISDDVHADFCFSGVHRFISDISDYVSNNSMICTSPAKTFNLAGLEISNVIIQNKVIREEFQKEIFCLGIHNPNYFSVPALYTAYISCDEWVDSLKKFILSNREYTKNFFNKNLPFLDVCKSDGTYLLWINYSKLKLDEYIFKEYIISKAKVELSWGTGFSECGNGFFRMNVAVPRDVLNKCLNNIYLALI